MAMAEKVPWDMAVKLCREIQEENKKKRLTPGAMQCWGCVSFSKGNPGLMCIGKAGCDQVNRRFAQLQALR